MAQPRPLTSEDAWDQLLAAGGRPQLMEVCCSPASELSATMLETAGPGSAARVSQFNGHDMSTNAGLEKARALRRKLKPKDLWVSVPCGPWSTMQNINQRTAAQIEELRQKRKRSVKLIKNVLVLMADHLEDEEIPEADVHWEWPRYATAYDLPLLKNFFLKYGFLTADLDGCRVGAAAVDTGEKIRKMWRIRTTSRLMQNCLSLRCECQDGHAKIEGKRTAATAYYPKDMCRRIVAAILEQKPGIPEFAAFSSETEETFHPECYAAADLEEKIQKMTAKQRQQIERYAQKLHSNSGHHPMKDIARALQAKGAAPEVVELVRRHKCSACQEKVKLPQSENPSSFDEIPRRFEVVGSDLAEWEHPVTKKKMKFLIMMCEGCRVVVGRWLFDYEEGQSRNATSPELLHHFQEGWRQYFGKPRKLRVDPEGAWMSNETLNKLASENIFLDPIAGEAHWQLGVVENVIKTIKEIMDGLALEFGDQVSGRECLARAVGAHNEQDMVRGFSPLQHVLGRAPDVDGQLWDNAADYNQLPTVDAEKVDEEFGASHEKRRKAESLMTDAIYKRRLERAERARNRRLLIYEPGQLVHYFRRGKGKKNKPGWRGQFFGPARVLAMETVKEADGQLRPGKSVWLTHGGRLKRAAPEQLRPASDREEAIANLTDPLGAEVPWTFGRMTGELVQGEYEDITEKPTTAELEDAENLPTNRKNKNSTEEQPTMKRGRWQEEQAEPNITEQRRPKREATEVLTGQGPRRRLRGKQPPPTAEQVAFWNDLSASIELEVEVPESRGARKEVVADLSCFVVSQLRKKRVEVSEKKLSPKELDLMKEAKAKEVKHWIVQKVLESLPEGHQIPEERVVNMRWLLTWKFDPQGPDGKKAKARIIIQGYQDPDLTTQETYSPTATRTSRQLFLQLAAKNRMLVEKGDVSAAFLQGRALDRELYVKLVDELAEALELPKRSIAKLRKSAYGLIAAPREWHAKVNSELTAMGFKQLHSDQAVWVLHRKNGNKTELVAEVLAHVDDFLLGGRSTDPEWLAIRSRIQGLFEWGEWEKNVFTQAGLEVRQLMNYGFELTQEQYITKVDPIELTTERRRQKNSPITEKERTAMRGVLGSINWRAVNSDPLACAWHSELQSKVKDGTVADIIELNKFLRWCQERSGQKILIHPFAEDDDLGLTAWGDAAHGNRPDGLSTTGVLIGCSPTKLWEGHETGVSLIYWKGGKQDRVTRSSPAAEIKAMVDAEDVLLGIRFQMAEMMGTEVDFYNPFAAATTIPGCLITDSKDLYDKMKQPEKLLQGRERRSGLELLGLLHGCRQTGTPMRWVHSDAMIANSLTKSKEKHQLEMFLKLGCKWRIVWDPKFTSARNRKKIGVEVLDAMPQNAYYHQDSGDSEDDNSVADITDGESSCG